MAKRQGSPATSDMARDGDSQVTGFSDGWLLTVTLHKGVASGATAELRNDRLGSHYAIMRQSTALFDLAPRGFEPEMSVDTQRRPTVIWRKNDGSSPFVWFCALDVAEWSHPL
jgi:hypothetical protein